MATEQNLIERLKALPDERQREVLSLIRRDMGKILDELSLMTMELSYVLDEKEQLAARVEKLLSDRNMIGLKFKAMLDAVAAVDPGTAAELRYVDSEQPETLLAHRGSIVVSGEQDFSAIRKDVIDEQVCQENR